MFLTPSPSEVAHLASVMANMGGAMAVIALVSADRTCLIGPSEASVALGARILLGCAVIGTLFEAGHVVLSMAAASP